MKIDQTVESVWRRSLCDGEEMGFFGFVGSIMAGVIALNKITIAQ